MPIRLIRDPDRDWIIEAQELERFIRETPELQLRQEMTGHGLIQFPMAPAQAELVWRSFFDDAAKAWKKLYGYLPIAKARAHLARVYVMHTFWRR